MSRVLATYNIKGGVGKTSAAVNLATLAARERRADAAVGPRPAGREHLPVPRPRQGQGRRREARARQERRRRAAQGHRHRRPGPAAGRLLLPPHGPRARRRQAPRTTGSRACSSRCRTSTSTRSWTARRASRWSPRPSSRPPTRCSCRSSRRRWLDARSSSSHSVLGQQRPAGPRLLLDGRPAQEAAPRADGQPQRRVRHPRHRDPEQRRRRAHGRATRRARGLRAARAAPRARTRTSGKRSARVSEVGRSGWGGRDVRLRSRRAVAALPAATRASSACGSRSAGCARA